MAQHATPIITFCPIARPPVTSSYGSSYSIGLTPRTPPSFGGGPGVSPVFIETPMHTPMVEDDEENAPTRSPSPDAGVFEFAESDDNDEPFSDDAGLPSEESQVLQELIAKAADLCRESDARNQFIRQIIAVNS